MEHYVTLFDSLFLPQGLALHASLQRHAGAHTLWVVCVDDAAHDALERLSLPNCVPLRLSALETDDLRRVKQERTRGEYCWTLTPFTPRFVFDAQPSARRVTYIDADIWLRRSPAPLFAELERSGAHVLITDHGYAPEYDMSATSGQFCVQFMVFDRDGGEPVRQWWQDRCIEWCYARYEPTRFGDQKYLDDWPERFPGTVHVLQRQELAQGPWCATRYPFGPAVFFHFSGLRIMPGRRIDYGPIYYLPQPLRQYVYQPYLHDLRQAVATLAAAGIEARPQASRHGLLTLLQRTLGAAYRQGWRLHQLRTSKY
jgi:hypothetical protein